MCVSWVRFRWNTVAPGHLISSFKCYARGMSFYDDCMSFAPYLSDPEILNVRFEDLIADKEDERLAKFMGVPLLSGIAKARPGGTASWSGQLSDWHEHWSPAIEDAWQAARLPVVEKEFGYAGTVYKDG